MTSPRLSVAMPVRNGENYLAEALESICCQSFADFELVVSENASTDATADILASFQKRDSRIKVSRCETMLPQVANINRSVSLTSGRWVKIICHDDMMRPDCLERIDAQLDLAESTGVGLIGNGERHLFMNGYATDPSVPVAPTQFSGRDAIVAILNGRNDFDIPALTTATVLKTAFEDVGGLNPAYRHMVDVFCWMELLVRYNFIYLPQPLTFNRIHGGQSASILTKELASVRDLQTFIPYFLDRYGDTLALPRSVKARARLKPLGEAAAKIANELMGGRQKKAMAMARTLPSYTLPMLSALVLRAWLKQRQSFAHHSGNVSRSMMFP